MNGKTTAAIAITDYEGTDDFPAEFAEALSLITTFTNGTGSGKANRFAADTRSLADTTSEDLDLAGGLNTPFGEAVTFTLIKAILVKAATANGGNIEIGGAASNQFIGFFKDTTDILAIPAGGAMLFIHPTTGWAVTAATGDLLKVNNTDSDTASYTIAVLGEGTV